MTTRTARTPVTVPTVTRGCGTPARTVHTAERARAAAQGVGAPVSIARAMRIFGGHSGAVCTRDARFIEIALFSIRFVCEEILCLHAVLWPALDSPPACERVCEIMNKPVLGRTPAAARDAAVAGCRGGVPPRPIGL
jgi:hypothetical protein